ncbi:MAG: 1-acyl-sn-glycerol-3-phosphate acyltransferase [Prevotella sp.]|nr:1-acyl-sn-glycerol-3-phosphate acyltransferase [Candidatus Prevotella equi]
MEEKFEDIRPYRDDEIPAAMERIAASTSFPLLASYVFPERNLDDVRNELKSYKTIREFQLGIMYWANKRIIEKSISEFTFSGIEYLSTDKNYLYVSNHRDIMLDASLLQNVLTDNGHDTSEITFGANLMQGQVVIDVGKSNKMFKVARPGGSVKDFYNASITLSEYIRHVITERNQSVWIAQRNGRTKNGIDRTDQGIVKMFGMSMSNDKVRALAELNIVPVSVSYEWESCDLLKTMELYERELGPYLKKPGEDLNSILTGITQRKGNVHFEICKPITPEELEELSDMTSNEFNKNVANIMDKRICSAYKLFPNNYIAHDILYGNTKYASMYSQEQKDAFVKHMKKLDRYSEDCNVEKLYEIFLGIYANPVESKKTFCNA